MSEQYDLRKRNQHAIMNKIILFITILFIIAISALTYASEPSLRFDRISTKDGLSQVNVQDIFQDSRGFLWIGTQDGLNRYDGHTFRVFRNAPGDTTSISDNLVLKIIEDRQGYLWVGTWNGLNRFNPKTEKFLRFKHNANTTQGISDNRILSLDEDQHGNIWVGTMRGLNKLDLSENKFTQYFHNKSDLHGLAGNEIHALYRDNKKNLWIGTRSGLSRLDFNERYFVNYRHEELDNFSLSHDFVTTIKEDSSGVLWIGTLGGLNRFNSSQKNFVRYIHNKTDLNSLINDNVLSIYEDRQQTLWIGTSYGLSKLESSRKYFTHYKHNGVDLGSLSGNNISAIAEDRQGVLWFGVREGGLNRLPPNSGHFTQYKHNLNYRLYLNNVMAVIEDQRGEIWTGTYSGLVRFNPSSKKVTSYLHIDGQIESLPHDEIHALLEDRNGRIWIGTTKGLSKLDPESGSFTHFKNSKLDPTSISHDYVTSIIEDTNGNIWVGTYFGGLSHFDPTKELFARFTHDKENQNTLSDNNISALFEDRLGNIWVGTFDAGLNKFNPNLNNFVRYKHNESDPKSLSHDSVTIITQDRNGILWIGTNNGLNQFDFDSDRFYHFARQHGLANSEVKAIIEDEQGYLWISTNHGLSKFDTKAKKFTNYFSDDGLLSSEFNEASFKNDNGEIFFGGTEGVTLFDPKDIKTDRRPTPIAFTDFLIFNRSVAIGKSHEYDNSVKTLDSEIKPSLQAFLLSQAINETKHLTLSHKESAFTFEFAALHFANPKMNQYAYRLEGWDKNWINTDYKNRRATYTNIPAGDYVFTVKASNRDGVWNEEGKSIKISILPPLWKTWWAYTLYFMAALSILTLIILLIYRRQLAEKDKASALEISSAKDKLFANVSHEFRTPLTLILGPLEKFLEKAETSEDRNELSLIKRNGQRLLGMVDQLLDLARLQGDQHSEHQPQNVRRIADFIVKSFESIALRKRIKLEYHLRTNGSLMVSMIPDALEKLLTNLLSNAVKYTSEQGSVCLTIGKGNSKTVLIKVHDTGCGIKQEDQEQIFNHFTRIENTTRDAPGTGIGLALVKELVESHGGSISVESELGEGSIFSVILPLSDPCTTPEVDDLNGVTPRVSSNEFVELALADLNTKSATKPTSPGEELSHESNAGEVADKPRILIVEDNSDLREYMIGLLNTRYHCLVAANGKLGLEAAIDQIPDLIISDIMMPEMDGYALTHAAKNDERTSHIPIILLTARGDKDSRLRGWQEQADEYLTKPFDSDELIVRIENILSIRDLLRHRFSSALFQSVSETLKIEEPADNQIEKEAIFMMKLEKIVSVSYTDPELKMSELASQIAMSERQFSRKLKGVLGITPTEYVRHFRLEKARDLLISGKAVGSVFVEVGFSSQSYFGKCFKAQYGKQPSEYKDNTQ